MNFSWAPLGSPEIEDAKWIQQRFDAVFPPEAPLDRNAFPGVAKVPILNGICWCFFLNFQWRVETLLLIFYIHKLVK